MRKLLVIFTLLFLTCTGTVQATNELDGNFLLCDKDRENVPDRIYGLIFDNGTLSKVAIDNYTKVVIYADREYTLTGRTVIWNDGIFNILDSGIVNTLDRETLKIETINLDRIVRGWSYSQCEISSFNEIMKKFDEVIVAGKKRRKI